MSRIKKILQPIVPQSVVHALLPYALLAKARKAGIKIVIHDLFLDLERDSSVLRIRRSHAIYLPHMIDSFDYYVDSVIPMPSNGRRLVDMSGPRYHRLKGFSDIPFLFPSHTEPYATTEEYLEFAGLSEGKVVLDIGAYSGVTSIIFAQLVGPTGHVYAFEADETNYACAKENIEMAGRVLGLRNITLMHKAIWSHSNGVMFSHEGAMGSSAIEITGRGRAKVRSVPSTTLADFFKENGLKGVDFIKVDIEGGEVPMFECSSGFLGTLRTRLIIEPHWVDGQLTTGRCRSLLEAAGYSVHVRDKVGGSEPLIEAVPKVA